MKKLFPALLILTIACQQKEVGKLAITASEPEKVVVQKYVNESGNTVADRLIPPKGFKRIETVSGSWPYFLQHLTLEKFGKPILKYDGTQISDQSHHVGILPYDIGDKDLQQCADALIRLRAEYLFAQKRYNEIGFDFTSGDHYTWSQYAKGILPVVKGNSVKFVQSDVLTQLDNHADFRRYLDIIFNYAGTISLSKELKDAKSKTSFDIGDIIDTPGSPGHIVMVVDKVTSGNKALYALVEGYTPAQSIHILSENGNPWFDIAPTAEVRTPRYYFKNPVFKRFE